MQDSDLKNRGLVAPMFVTHHLGRSWRYRAVDGIHRWSPNMMCALLVRLMATSCLYCCGKTLCDGCCWFRTFEVCVELNLSIGVTYHEKMTSMSISPEEQAK